MPEWEGSLLLFVPNPYLTPQQFLVFFSLARPLGGGLMNTLLPLYRVQITAAFVFNSSPQGRPAAFPRVFFWAACFAFPFWGKTNRPGLWVELLWQRQREKRGQAEEEQRGTAPAWISLWLFAPSCEWVQSPSRGLHCGSNVTFATCPVTPSWYWHIFIFLNCSFAVKDGRGPQNSELSFFFF